MTAFHSSSTFVKRRRHSGRAQFVSSKSAIQKRKCHPEAKRIANAIRVGEHLLTQVRALVRPTLVVVHARRRVIADGEEPHCLSMRTEELGVAHRATRAGRGET